MRLRNGKYGPYLQLSGGGGGNGGGSEGNGGDGGKAAEAKPRNLALPASAATAELSLEVRGCFQGPTG